jgi:hypothetical protein
LLLLHEIQAWLKEDGGFNVIITPTYACYNISSIVKYSKLYDTSKEMIKEGLPFKDFISYEEALEQGLAEAVKLIKA